VKTLRVSWTEVDGDVEEGPDGQMKIKDGTEKTTVKEGLTRGYIMMPTHQGPVASAIVQHGELLMLIPTSALKVIGPCDD
jgi:hypothetical protein